MNSLWIIAGIPIGTLLTFLFYRVRLGHFQEIQNRFIQQGELEADRLKQKAELEKLEKQKEFEKYCQEEKLKLQNEKQKLENKEDKLEVRMNLMEKKFSQIEKREAVLSARKEELDALKLSLKSEQLDLNAKLESLSGLTTQEAKDLILENLKEEVKLESANYIRKVQAETEEQAERHAARIISTAINRLAVPCVSEATTHSVTLPSDEIKGRVIGREGRNIRTLERLTGVNFIIDDTPNAIVLTGFDPIRLHIAKTALTELVHDGRIHPTSIEESIQRAGESVHKKMIEYGEDACHRTGIGTLHPELIKLLGKLKFRYSFGQNVLDHSVEVSHIMGMIAAELGLDVRMAKRIGLLHDVGKALTQEVEGTHALIGRDYALKYGETKEVANGIGCHHGEIDPITIEGSFCAAADAISGARPGARLEAVQEYMNRLTSLEKLAYEFPGVERAYAMQAGREIVTVVRSDKVDDAGCLNIARDLTKRIEEELNYPGKIKVTVLREQRAIQYAL